MTSFISFALVSLAISQSVLSQGDPEALTGSKFNQPTKSWQQWQPKPTYALDKLPDQYMGANRIPGGGEPQSGFNRCAKDAWNQKSLCQTAWINDVNDWCIWGPPDGGDVGSTERVAVAYCTTEKHGTRLIPDGTLTSVHFLKTPSYVQVSGTGDFTSIGIPQGDTGGEMDSAGADDLGNPIGGVFFTTANPESNGKSWQVSHWTNFMSWDQYCIRACWGDQASAHCEHIYDVMGCKWNMPSESGYTADIWESCEGEDAPLQGIFNGSTFHQGEPVTPDAHPPAASSNCKSQASLGHGLYAVSNLAIAASSSSSPSSLTVSSSISSVTSSSSSSTSSASSSAASTPTGMATTSRSQNAASQNTNEANRSSSSSNNTGGASNVHATTFTLLTVGISALVASCLAL